MKQVSDGFERRAMCKAHEPWKGEAYSRTLSRYAASRNAADALLSNPSILRHEGHPCMRVPFAKVYPTFMGRPSVITHILPGHQGIGQVLLHQLFRGQAGRARNDLNAVFPEKA